MQHPKWERESFSRLVIDAAKTRGERMFRLAERPSVLLVDETLKHALDAAQLRGVRVDPWKRRARAHVMNTRLDSGAPTTRD